MMHTDFLIIGQGIAGTLLSYELTQAGKSVVVMDAPHSNKASLVASAVINPLIGKNWTIAKDAEVLIPSAIHTYNALGKRLGADLLAEKRLFIFHQNEKEEINFTKQIAEGNPYLSIPGTDMLQQSFIVENGIGKVAPVYTVDAATLLEKWKNHLQKQSSFIEDQFDFEALDISENKVDYKGITAGKLIFCEGAPGRNNPFFSGQHFTANRGDVLLLSIPGLDNESLYQKSIRLVPRHDGLFWCGSNYTWKYDSLLPDMAWSRNTEAHLRNWLKLPFEITEHLVAERPTTAGQEPVLTQHPVCRNLYFFNGLGTRGFSAGPSLAKRMLALLLQEHNG